MCEGLGCVGSALGSRCGGRERGEGRGGWENLDCTGHALGCNDRGRAEDSVRADAKGGRQGKGGGAG